MLTVDKEHHCTAIAPPLENATSLRGCNLSETSHPDEAAAALRAQEAEEEGPTAEAVRAWGMHRRSLLTVGDQIGPPQQQGGPWRTGAEPR